ncbi:MAG TPA: hypothetical protein VFM03_08725, partial [Candidatus Limnocylindria bacterium]|nr:hypothetical protein [Candidatus Limnocylindria bacterium]
RHTRSIHIMYRRIGRAAALGAALTLLVGIGVASAHEQRDVGDYTFTVGFLEEPVFTGQKSGLDLRVARGEEPVEGLETTLQAEVSFNGQTRDLEISPVFGQPGAYRSVFFPTAAGPYSFHITGDVEGTPVDETFTSGPDTFSEVQDVAGGQFPIQYPATGDIARDAEAGANAATTATIGVVLGGAGLLVGLVALGLTIARRRA